MDVESRNFTIDTPEALRKEGATWFVTTRVMEIDKKVISYLQNNYDVLEMTDRYLIAKL